MNPRFIGCLMGVAILSRVPGAGWPRVSSALIDKNGKFAGFGYWKGGWKRMAIEIEQVL
jgi:hypothetical protein